MPKTSLKFRLNQPWWKWQLKSVHTSPVIYPDGDDDKVNEASMFFINITKWVKNDAKEDDKLLMLINYMDDDKKLMKIYVLGQPT